MKYDLIIFDMDGTLYKMENDPKREFFDNDFFRDIRKNCVDYISRLEGVDIEKAEQAMQSIIDEYQGEWSKGFIEKYGVDRKEYFSNTWNLDAEKFVGKNDNLRGILNSISCKKAVLTSAPEVWAENVLDRLNIRDVFDGVWFGDVDIRKPDKRAYIQVADALGVEIGNCLMVEDEERFLLPTKELGMDAVFIGKNKYADYNIQSIEDITGIVNEKIIIDTDPGHDDALALMLAAKSKELDIAAVTTVAGNSTIENTTRNARYILRLLDREDIPVYSGSERPLKRELVQAVVHGKSGLEGIDPTNEPKLNGRAVEEISNIAENNEDITLITLGPLTNIAKAIKQYPDAMKQVKEIVMMGGAVNVPGNKSKYAEFNIFVDPDAADIVFRFPVKKTLVPLDACNYVALQLDEFDELKGNRLYEPIIAMMKPYIKNIELDEGTKGALMYDPLTVFYLLQPETAKVEKYNLKVETKGEKAGKLMILEGNPNIDVVEYIPKNAFKMSFLEALK
ncbi:HAD-IA family hydrolase [Candidatus Woesearchaeota archaeon]|nr:HAD-IA family hydrolase [Candidatus Woesearchaeota archaeon]